MAQQARENAWRLPQRFVENLTSFGGDDHYCGFFWLQFGYGYKKKRKRKVLLTQSYINYRDSRVFFLSANASLWPTTSTHNLFASRIVDWENKSFC